MANWENKVIVSVSFKLPLLEFVDFIMGDIDAICHIRNIIKKNPVIEKLYLN